MNEYNGGWARGKEPNRTNHRQQFQKMVDWPIGADCFWKTKDEVDRFTAWLASEQWGEYKRSDLS